MISEGCNWCRDYNDHKEHEKVLAGILDVPMYDDGSGYDFHQYKGSWDRGMNNG